jgi:serine/threonine-protein kinase
MLPRDREEHTQPRGALEQRILLTDLGIARNVNDISGLTTTNMTVGTVAYSAPEQLMAEDIDGRADQYALAASAYHLLTGSHLFPHSNPVVVISRHLNSPPPSLADVRPDLALVDSVLATALDKNPDDRFARCSDFARALAEHFSAECSPSPIAATKPALRSLRARPNISEAPSAGIPSPQQPTTGPSRSRWLIAVAAALAVIVVASALVLAWHPWESGRTAAASPTPASSK